MSSDGLENARQTLSNWCTKTNNFLTVEHRVVGSGINEKHECLVKVAGYAYTGFGSSNNRLEAVEIGSQNFLNFLEYSKVNYKSKTVLKRETSGESGQSAAMDISLSNPSNETDACTDIDVIPVSRTSHSDSGIAGVSNGSRTRIEFEQDDVMLLMNEPAFRPMVESIRPAQFLPPLDVCEIVDTEHERTNTIEHMSIDDANLVVVDSTDPNEKIEDVVCVFEKAAATATAAVETVTVEDAVEQLPKVYDPKLMEIKFDFDFIDHDEIAHEHGHWTLKRAKHRLDLFLQRQKLSPNYEYSNVAIDSKIAKVAELRLKLHGHEEEFYARGASTNHRKASKVCALHMIRILYHAGIIEKCPVEETGEAAAAATTKSKIGKAMFEIELSTELIGQLNTCLQRNNIDFKPVLMTPAAANKQQTGERLLFDATANLYAETSVEGDGDDESLSGTNETKIVIEWTTSVDGYDAWRSTKLPAESHWASMNLDYAGVILKQQRVDQMKNEYAQMMLRDRENLPVFQEKAAILDLIRSNTVTIIKGTTGCGKSTQVCQYILDDELMATRGGHCNIIVTQPRRIAAIALAERVAFERSEMLGNSVGYCVRHDCCMPRPFGAICFMTVGTLLKRLSNGLTGVSHLIVDEIHERDISTDFLLIILRELVRKHPEIRVILMSATIDTKLFTDYFEEETTANVGSIDAVDAVEAAEVAETDGTNDCQIVRTTPVFEIVTKFHDIEMFYLEDVVQKTAYRPSAKKQKRFNDSIIETEFFDADPENNCNLHLEDSYPQFVRDSMEKMQEKEIDFDLIVKLIRYIESLRIDGSILIFLPGWQEIISLIEYMQNNKSSQFGGAKYKILPLHSLLPKSEQQKCFDPAAIGQLKIVVATNIAESSITIHDVVFVIDSCQVKLKYFNPNTNVVTYKTNWISKSNVMQRRGRAGRIRDGFYFCLASRERVNRFDAHIVPEMHRSSLEELALTVKYLNLGSIRGFLARALEPPPEHAVIEAEVLLKRIGAINSNNEITPLGKLLAQLPIEPRLGKMLIIGCVFECANELITLAAITSTLGEVFNFKSLNLTPDQMDTYCGIRNSDHLTMLSLYNTWENNLHTSMQKAIEFCDEHNFQISTMKSTFETRKHIFQKLVQLGFPKQSLRPVTVKMNQFDDDLDTAVAVLCTAFYPNVYYTYSNRMVKCNDHKQAIIHRSSQNIGANKRDFFLSPFFIYAEKLKTNMVMCKQTSMVSPIHLLLFGCRRVTLVDDIVYLDSFIRLKIDPTLAVKILSLRAAFDRVVSEVAMAPDNIFDRSANDFMLIGTIRELCKMTAPLRVKPEFPSEASVPMPMPMPMTMSSSQFRPVARNSFRAGHRGYYHSNMQQRGGRSSWSKTSISRHLNPMTITLDDDDDDKNDNSGRGNDTGPKLSQRGLGKRIYATSSRASSENDMEVGTSFGPPEQNDEIVTLDYDESSGMRQDFEYAQRDWQRRNDCPSPPTDDQHLYPWQKAQQHGHQSFPYNMQQPPPPYFNNFHINQMVPFRGRGRGRSGGYYSQPPNFSYAPMMRSGPPPSIFEIDAEPPSFENRPMTESNRSRMSAGTFIGIAGMPRPQPKRGRHSFQRRGRRGSALSNTYIPSTITYT